MDGLFLIGTIVAILAVIDVLAMRIGVDSRTWTRDGRPMTIALS